MTGSSSYNTLSGVSATPATNTFIAGAATGGYSFNVAVSDASPMTKNSLSVNFGVNAMLVAGAPTASFPIISTGSTTLTATASGGTPNPALAYLWYTAAGAGLTPSCTSAYLILGAVGNTYVASPVTSNTYWYQVTDQASSPASACSPGANVMYTNNPGFVAGFSVASAKSTTSNTALTATAGSFTYFYGMAKTSYGSTSVTCPSVWSATNTIQLTSNDVCGTTIDNVTAIGYNSQQLGITTANLGNVVGDTVAGTAAYNGLIAAISANVIFTNNDFAVYTGPSSANSLSFKTTTSNELVFLIYAMSGNNIGPSPFRPVLDARGRPTLTSSHTRASMLRIA